MCNNIADRGNYTVLIGDNSYELPKIEVAPGVKIAVMDMLSDIQMTRDAVKSIIRAVEKEIDLDEIHTVVSAEAKGISLAFGVADELDKDLVILRKTKKLYIPDYLESTLETITTEGDQRLYLNKELLPLIRGKNVLIVDDVISSGSSLEAMESLICQAGGNVVCRAFVLAEGDAYKREDVTFYNRIPIFKEG